MLIPPVSGESHTPGFFHFLECTRERSAFVSPRLYVDQRRFFAALVATDARISHYVGRLETRYVENEAATELLELLRSLPMKIDLSVYRRLDALGRRHQRTAVKLDQLWFADCRM